MAYRKYYRSKKTYLNKLSQYDPDKEFDKYMKKLYRIDTNKRMSDVEKRIAYSDAHNMYSSKSSHARMYADNFKSINPELYANSSERWNYHHEKHKDDWHNERINKEMISANSWDKHHEEHKDDWYNDYKKRHSD